MALTDPNLDPTYEGEGSRAVETHCKRCGAVLLRTQWGASGTWFVVCSDDDCRRTSANRELAPIGSAFSFSDEQTYR